MLKLRKLINKGGIWYVQQEWTQVDSNPTSIASILIKIDSIEKNQMLEIIKL